MTRDKVSCTRGFGGGGGGHTTGVHTLIITKAKDEDSAKVLIFYRNGKIRTASSTQNYYVQGAASSQHPE